jgi:probable rRNA maturation factor
MISVEVFSEEKAWSKKLRKKEFFFKEICNFFPRKYRFPNKKITLSLLLSNNKCIKKLNKNFRNKNKSTDILSFPLEKKISIYKSTYIGDIIISYNFMNKPKSQNIKNFKEKVD